jgi:hypothetical protein
MFDYLLKNGAGTTGKQYNDVFDGFHGFHGSSRYLEKGDSLLLVATRHARIGFIKLLLKAARGPFHLHENAGRNALNVEIAGSPENIREIHKLIHQKIDQDQKKRAVYLHRTLIREAGDQTFHPVSPVGPGSPVGPVGPVDPEDIRSYLRGANDDQTFHPVSPVGPGSPVGPVGPVDKAEDIRSYLRGANYDILKGLYEMVGLSPEQAVQQIQISKWLEMRKQWSSLIKKRMQGGELTQQEEAHFQKLKQSLEKMGMFDILYDRWKQLRDKKRNRQEEQTFIELDQQLRQMDPSQERRIKKIGAEISKQVQEQSIEQEV